MLRVVKTDNNYFDYLADRASLNSSSTFSIKLELVDLASMVNEPSIF